MIARFDIIYFFADSLGRKRSLYFFLTKQVSAIGLPKATKLDENFSQFSQHFVFLNSPTKLT